MSDIFDRLHVSRETLDRMTTYNDLLRKWNPRINLVSRATLDDAWDRHIRDSAQVYALAPPAEHWIDLGSGGGFPGLVCAILAAGEGHPTRFTLVESDQRKCAFLRAVTRETGIKATVASARIEAHPPAEADVLTARALADLPTLLGFAERHLTPTGIALFPKGRSWEKEVEEAHKTWRFNLETIKSETEDEAVILKIEGAARV